MTPTEVRVRGAHATVRADGFEDEVAVEEPLEIRAGGARWRDHAHARPRLGARARLPYGEGLIDGPRAAGPPPDLAGNTVEVEGPLLFEPSARPFFTTSSCGVCGKGALEEVAVHAAPLPDGPVIARALLAQLPERLRQPTFAHRRPARDRAVQPAGELRSCARTSAATTRWTR